MLILFLDIVTHVHVHEMWRKDEHTSVILHLIDRIFAFACLLQDFHILSLLLYLAMERMAYIR